jgi:protein TonB
MASPADTFSARPSIDPFARIASLDEQGERRFVISIFATLALYAAVATPALLLFTDLHGFAADVQRAFERKHPLEVEIQEPPPPPAEPEPEKAAEPVPEKLPEPPPKANTPPPAPPAAAQAAAVMTAAPDPDEPVDLTGDGFVQGTGDTYAGGVTTTAGTSKTAVRDLRAVGVGSNGLVSDKGVSNAPRVDRSKAALPLSGSWDHCGFPAEADIEQVNNARVSIAVTVSADGHAQSANILQEPGFGFGALTKRCAIRERYSPALGKDGNPITATQVITINFRR